MPVLSHTLSKHNNSTSYKAVQFTAQMRHTKNTVTSYCRHLTSNKGVISYLSRKKPESSKTSPFWLLQIHPPTPAKHFWSSVSTHWNTLFKLFSQTHVIFKVKERVSLHLGWSSYGLGSLPPSCSKWSHIKIGEIPKVQGPPEALGSQKGLQEIWAKILSCFI